MKSVPRGIQSFSKVIERDYYYVDKSPMIDLILSERAEVYLFTRPRRFGKSLNLSMLDCYFNQRFKGNPWFDDLRISELRPNDSKKNAYPVINLDLKDVNSSSFDLFYEWMVEKVRKICIQFGDVRNHGFDKDILDDYEALRGRKATRVQMEGSLRTLSELISQTYGRKVVILIDEYDNPVNNSSDPEVRREILDFLRSFLGSALKGNDSLEFAVLTGIMRIAHESIFSGLNNLTVNDVFSTEADEMFGFTSDEVSAMCDDFGHPEKFSEAQQWYDGYRFGNADIYNPWSVLNYVGEGFEPGAYWAGTSGNDIIRDSLEILDSEGIDALTDLMEGKTVGWEILRAVEYSQMSDPSAVFSIMVASGYLKAETTDGDSFILSIPNREMAWVFREGVRAWMGIRGNSDKVRNLLSALIGNDPARVSELLTNLIAPRISVRTEEKCYQTFLLGMMSMFGDEYDISEERGSGSGCCDIMMTGNGVSIVIETKVARKDETLESAAERALKQIRERGYHRGLKGRIVLYGIAFGKKTALAVSESPAP